MTRSGWTGMDKILQDLESADPAKAVEHALEQVADAAAEEIRAAWPVKTGATRDAWRGEGTAVVNPRPEVSHIRNGLVARMVPPILDDQVETFEEALDKALGLG